MNDILPEQTPYWQWLEAVVKSVLTGYGYNEIRLPILEKTYLFARSIGEVTDIVEKEMYTFLDRNGDSLTLRPEGTAGCVRAGIQNGLLRGQQRLWYQGPMFRHERPQKGRYRQFHQIGVEIYGVDGPDIDAELILMGKRIWRTLGLHDLTLELNSLGSTDARAHYRRELVAYLQDSRDRLDEDSRRRLETNPLRILDSKNPDVQALIAGAPSILDYLDGPSQDHFGKLRATLDATDTPHVVNPRMVRGLDYYGKTVFEWTTTQLGAQGTICAGGRYDALVEQLGGKSIPAVGFAMGLERMVALLRDSATSPTHHLPHAYMVTVGAAATDAGARLAELLRDRLPALRLTANAGGGSFRSQMKRADRSGAQVAIVVGDEEVAHERFGLKELRTDSPQLTLSAEDTVLRLAQAIEAS